MATISKPAMRLRTRKVIAKQGNLDLVDVYYLVNMRRAWRWEDRDVCDLHQPLKNRFADVGIRLDRRKVCRATTVQDVYEVVWTAIPEGNRD